MSRQDVLLLYYFCITFVLPESEDAVHLPLHETNISFTQHIYLFVILIHVVHGEKIIRVFYFRKIVLNFTKKDDHHAIFYRHVLSFITFVDELDKICLEFRYSNETMVYLLEKNNDPVHKDRPRNQVDYFCSIFKSIVQEYTCQ